MLTRTPNVRPVTESPQQWLKRTRTAAGYTKQASLSVAVGVGRGAVGNWETTGRPDLKNVPALAGALGVPAQEIIDRFGIPSGGGVVAAMPAWASELITRMDQQAKMLTRLVDLGQKSQTAQETLGQAIGELAAMVDALRPVPIPAVGEQETPAGTQQ